MSVTLELKGKEYRVSSKQVAEARRWVSDAFDEDISELTDHQVIRGIARHYSGGIEAFLASCPK